jgi:hypothetical protein
LYYFGARYYDPSTSVWLGVDKMAGKYPNFSPFTYCANNPVILIDPNGNEAKPPKLLLVFYHGGPTGNGQIHENTKNTGYTGNIYNYAYSEGIRSGREVVGAIIAPAPTQGFGVRTGLDFIEKNYSPGDQIILYGYSYGGDNAVNLAEAAQAKGITISTMIIIDSSDGILHQSTVDNSVSSNVDYTLNIYQTKASGEFLKSLGDSDNPNSSENSSSDGSSNTMASRGFPLSPEGKNRVDNVNATAPKTNHGNIQQKEEFLIKTVISSRINKYDNQ